MSNTEKPRGTYLGGYDASAILGVSKYGTPLSVWLEKTGQSPANKEPNLAMELGLYLEPFVLAKAEQELKTVITNRQDFVIHPDHDFICGHIDGLCVIDRDLVLIDAKTTSAYNKHNFGDDLDPTNSALWQIYHYFSCLPSVKYAYVVALIGNTDLRFIKIERNQNVIDELVKLEADFWNIYVVNGTPPPAEKLTADDAKNVISLFPVVDEDYIETDDLTVISMLSDLSEIKSMLKTYGAKEKELQVKLGFYLGGHAGCNAGKYSYTWKDQTTNRVSTDLLKAKYPDIAKELTTITTSRVFRLKENKE